MEEEKGVETESGRSTESDRRPPFHSTEHETKRQDLDKALLNANDKTVNIGTSHEKSRLSEAQMSVRRKISQLLIEKILFSSKFYVVHIGYQDYENRGIVPNELCAAEFSINGGVSRVFHRFIRADGTCIVGKTVPDAVLLNEELDHSCNMRALGEVYLELTSFVSQGAPEFSNVLFTTNNVAVFFNSDKVDVKLQKTLEKMRAAAGSKITYEILPVLLLFYDVMLHKKEMSTLFVSSQVPISELSLTLKLEQNACYTACDFHKMSDDRTKCSQALVLTWVYNIVEACMIYKQLDVVEGRNTFPSSREKLPLNHYSSYLLNQSFPSPKKDEVQMPKRPACAYIIWLKENREFIKKQNPGLPSTDLPRKASEMWRELENKAPWEKKAQEQKENYDKAMKQYKLSKAKGSCIKKRKRTRVSQQKKVEVIEGEKSNSDEESVLDDQSEGGLIGKEPEESDKETSLKKPAISSEKSAEAGTSKEDVEDTTQST